MSGSGLNHPQTTAEAGCSEQRVAPLGKIGLPSSSKQRLLGPIAACCGARVLARWLGRSASLRTVHLALCAAVMVSTMLANPVAAQLPVAAVTSSPGDYHLLAFTLDGGGGRSSGGSFAMQGTLSQPDADPLHPASGGGYSIVGGFWGGVLDRPEGLFRDGFEAD